jgi:hypothetical protein
MPIASAPIHPSAPAPVYCTECGCEVDPVAWLCATCGKNLHEPGAMSSTRPFAPVTTKNFKPDFILGAEIFAILFTVGFFILDFGLRSGLIRTWNPGHTLGSPAVVYFLALLLILWVICTDKP